MSKTVLLIHGRAPKPSEKDLKGFWVEALRHGLERDHPEKLADFSQAHVEFLYYGNLNNEFLDPDHDLEADAASRRTTLNELKDYSRGDFDRARYDSLPGKSALKEFVADTFADLFHVFRASDPLIHLVAPDMREYWNPESEFGTNVGYPMIGPLRQAMDRQAKDRQAKDRQAKDPMDKILVIGHSLGSMISFDTFWKLSRMGEYRPDYRKEKSISRFDW